MKAIKADHFVTPTVEFRLEDHGIGPMLRLVKERLEGLLPPARLVRRCVPAEADWSFVHISFPSIGGDIHQLECRHRFDWGAGEKSGGVIHFWV